VNTVQPRKNAETVEGAPAVFADDRDEWRSWLAENCAKHDAAWLVLYKKASDQPSVSYAEAVEEALCFGWVDSKTVRRDEQSRYQRFSPRRARSNWSQSNRDRVERLIAEGRMTEHGQAVIDRAKQNGTW
jgi:uncharacterized protein YdeI (YjbR/CyaY-like superfamily)